MFPETALWADGFPAALADENTVDSLENMVDVRCRGVTLTVQWRFQVERGFIVPSVHVTAISVSIDCFLQDTAQQIIRVLADD